MALKTPEAWVCARGISHGMELQAGFDWPSWVTRLIWCQVYGSLICAHSIMRVIQLNSDDHDHSNKLLIQNNLINFLCSSGLHSLLAVTTDDVSHLSESSLNHDCLR